MGNVLQEMGRAGGEKISHTNRQGYCKAQSAQEIDVKEAKRTEWAWDEMGIRNKDKTRDKS
jgi:hypothetical protein